MALTKIVTSEQMGRIERLCEEAGVTTDALMEQAGLAVARQVLRRLETLGGVPVAILVGPGNNGGDGLVAARHLHQWGAAVTVYLCLERRRPDPKLVSVVERGVTVLRAWDDPGLVELERVLGSTRMVVDSVLGTGRARPIEGLLKEVLLAVSAAAARRPDLTVLSVDLPTGLDADTGAVDTACLSADITLTLGCPKVGLFTPSAAEKVGSLETVDIGIPPGLDEDIELELMSPDWVRERLPARPAAAHKGTFGRTLVVAGSRSYIGAAYLAAAAASRVGAGLVTLAIPESLQAAVAAKAVEPTYLPLPEVSPGVVSAEAGSVVLENLVGFEALLLGCGIGRAPTTRAMVEALLYGGVPLPPAVVDADGLNLLSEPEPGNGSWWKRFSSEAVLTPHPGEMARLAPELAGRVQNDRIGVARETASRWNKVVVLKGAYTVVASPGGSAMISPFANPGLATAGTGDVLAGAIAGLLSQGLALRDAASLGVYLHGAAGELVRAEIGDTGMVASDLLPVLPRAIKALRERVQGLGFG